jgi:hypothetical protein
MAAHLQGEGSAPEKFNGTVTGHKTRFPPGPDRALRRN